jgi:hypothetical protein
LTLFLLTFMHFLQELHCFSIHFTELILHKGDLLSTWKLTSRQYSFKKLSQFTMLNKLPSPVASNIHDSLTRATRNFPFACMGYFAKLCSWPMKTLRGTQYSFTQLTQFTMLNKVVDPFLSNINDSLSNSTVLLPIPFRGLYCTKVVFLTHEHTEL